MIYDLAFPHLNIFIEKLNSGFSIFGFYIAFYGIIIAIAMLVGLHVALFISKKTNQNEDVYYDLFVFILISAIVGARLYYVIFNIDYYSKNILEIFNLRAGGLAVYGGIILSIITIVIFCKIKKINILKTIDTCVVGLSIGQSIGRWGNFFNMEAYGTYTDNLFAMQMRVDKLDSANIDQIMKKNIVNINGIDYVNAHPTFLYESICTFILFLILLFLILNFYKFFSQILATYFIGYGIIRFFVEKLRTDSLYILGTNLKISEMLSFVLIFVGIFIYIFNIIKIIKNKNTEENL